MDLVSIYHREVSFLDIFFPLLTLCRQNPIDKRPDNSAT
jgi:hypothetical protein